MGNTISQIAPPKPTLTEHELSDQDGKVFIVTGGASGVGFELSKLLYQKNGTIYVAGRSREKGLAAIELIRSAFSSSTSKIDFLHVDLDDLTGIKASVEGFMDKEERLDVLWNNAGVMLPPAGTATKQGYELQLGTNCVAPFLFTQLLIPILKRTAASSPLGSVRVCWTGSIVIETTAPQGGIIIEDLEYKEPVNQRVKYAQSKVGNLFLSVEMAKRHREDGIMFLCLNPGNLKTALTRHIPDLTNTVLRSAFYEPIYGAYTELYAGLSPDLTMENTGSYIIPWGRIGPIRNDIAQAIRPANEGGRDKALKFYMWCEKQVANYM